MKKRLAGILLILTWLILLAGCSGQRAEEPQQPVQEPDTDTRTLTRTISRNQTVVYRFHAEAVTWRDYTNIKIAFFDKDVEDFDKADNWCTARIGDTRAEHPFFAEHAKEVPEEEQWDSSFGFRANWTMLIPYDSIEVVEDADMELTFTRSGEQVRAVLAVDGARAWEGQQTIGNLTDDSVWLAVYAKNCMLSDITFQDMGDTGWLIPTWLRLLLIAAVLAGTFVLHTLAKKGEDKLFLIDGGFALPTTGLFVCSFALALLIYGRGHPDILSRISFGYIPFQLPAGGLGFWIPVVVAGVGAAVLVGFLIWLALEECGNPVAHVLGSLLFGLCHTLWFSSIVIVILRSLSQIVELIVAVLFIVLLIIVAGGALNTKKKYKEVVTTTRMYNSIGNLVDAKFDIDYVEVPEEKSKKE